MSIYLESYLEKYPDSQYLFLSDKDLKAPDRLKGTFVSRLRKVVWKTDEFKEISDNANDDENCGIGTHSGGKLPAEYARNCGCDHDEVKIHGR